MARVAKMSPVVKVNCISPETKEVIQYERCAGRTSLDDCERGGKSSCKWIVDPKGPQESYCRGSMEVIKK